MKVCWNIILRLNNRIMKVKKSGELDNVLKFGLSFKILFIAPRGIVDEISRAHSFFILF